MTLFPVFFQPFGVVTAVLLIGWGLWVWMLLDAVQEPEPMDRIVWAIILVGAPAIGPLVYLFARYLPRRPGLRARLWRLLLWPRTAGRHAPRPEPPLEDRSGS